MKRREPQTPRFIDDEELRELELGFGDKYRVPVDGRLTRAAIEYAEEEGIELEFESYAHKAMALGRPGPEELDRLARGIADGLLAEMGRRAVRERSSVTPVPLQETTYVVAAHGADRPGIIAAVAGVLAGEGLNIIDISQKVMAGMFALILLVDASGASCSLGELRYRLRAELEPLGTEIKVSQGVY